MDTYFIGYHEHTIIFLHYLLGNSMMLLTLIHIRIYVQSYPCLGSESKRHRIEHTSPFPFQSSPLQEMLAN